VAKTKRNARIISQATVDSYDRRLTTAVLKALDAQVSSVNATLRAAGVVGSLTAAGKKKKAAGVAVGAIVVQNAWSQAQWTYVNEYLEPEARSVTADAEAAALAALGAAAVMGAASSADAMAAKAVEKAIRAGEAIGGRVTAAGIADDDVLAGMQAVFDTSGSILTNLIGAMGQAIANQAEQSQAVSVTSYGAPTYLSATKTWNSQEDDRVRPDHEDADGQEVAINENFNVGGEDMTGPGDPAASPEQTEGCRCYVSYDGLVPAGTEDSMEDETPMDGLENAYG
jgi:hypothetical protein